MPKDWKCVGHSEIDKHASMVLKYRFPDVKNYGDINAIKWDEVPDFDILFGGTPCQDLSLAGKRKGLAGERSGLFFKFVEALKAKKPEYFVWENVKGAKSSNQGWDFAEVINQFSEAGYSLWWQVLNAKDFGVPQNRERIFIVGFRDRSPSEVFFERENESSFSIREERAKSKTKFYNSITSKEGRRKENNFILIPSATKNGFEVAEEGDGLSLVHIGSTTGRGRVGNKKAQALVRSGTAYTIQNQQIRRLMPIECERLMSWSDDWTKYGIHKTGKVIEISDSQRYKMIGNGVVSNVVEWIIKNIIMG